MERCLLISDFSHECGQDFSSRRRSRFPRWRQPKPRLDHRSRAFGGSVLRQAHGGRERARGVRRAVGDRDLRPEDLAGTLRVDAAIEAKSINTRNPDRDKDLRSSLFFDVDKFPRITFKSKRAEAAGPNHVKVVGDLTMHGVTKEVTLDVQGPRRKSRTSGAACAWAQPRQPRSIDVSYGLLYNRVLEAGGAVVGNEVSITIDLEVTRQAAAKE